MNTVIISIAALIGGLLIALLNARFTASKMKGDSTAVLLSAVFLRQLLNIAYLTAVFLLVRKLELPVLWPLVAAAVGLTVPSVLLSVKLSQSVKTDINNINDENLKGGED